MRICRVFLPAVFAAGLLAAGFAAADNAPPAPAPAGAVKFAAAAKAAAGKRNAVKAGPRMGKHPAAAGPRAIGRQAGAAAAKTGNFTLPPDESRTSLDISFGDDDDDRPDGGIDKLSSPAVVGLEHKFGDNVSIGGGALFDGRGRGAAAQLGFSW